MTVVITWLALMVAGLVLTSWFLADVYVDRRTLDAAGITNGRRMLVDGDIRSAQVRVAAFVFFVITGVVALLAEIAILVDESRIGSRVALLCGAALLVSDAWLTRRTRRLLLAEQRKT